MKSRFGRGEEGRGEGIRMVPLPAGDFDAEEVLNSSSIGRRCCLGSAIDGGIGEGRHRPVTADEPTAGASRRGGGEADREASSRGEADRGAATGSGLIRVAFRGGGGNRIKGGWGGRGVEEPGSDGG
jgi:hypothetical protein